MIEARRAYARRLVEERATPEPNTGCLLWTGALEGKGAHRGEGYAAAKSPFGKLKIIRALLGLTDPKVLALHSCDTPACVNEQHLAPGDAFKNMQDKVRRGRDYNAKRTTCLLGHPLDGRYRDGKGWVRYCKTCKQGRRRSPEAQRASSKKYYEANAEACRAASRAYYHAHRDAIALRRRKRAP
jgi:hypothetical protein